MLNKKFLPVSVSLKFPKNRTFKNEDHRANETLQLSYLVSQLDYSKAMAN